MEITDGEALRDELEILSWNIQKASNVGWAEDLASISGDIDLAFIQEASVQAQIPQVLSGSLYQAFAQGYTTDSHGNRRHDPECQLSQRGMQADILGALAGDT